MMLNQQSPDIGKIEKRAANGRRHIQKIWEAFMGGDLGGAQRMCRSLLVVDNTNAEGWHLAALIAQRLGDMNQSVQSLNRAIQYDPGNPEYHNNLGVMYRSLGRLDEAINSYHQAIRLAPASANAYSNLGVILRLQGKFQRSLDYCREAIRLAPESEGGYYNLALTYQAMGLLNDAISTYRRNLKINPQHAVSWHNLGTALLHQNRFDAAGACFERALAIQRDYPEALNGLSHIRRIEKKPAEAIELAQSALRLKPDFPEALAHAAVLYQQTCNWGKLRSIEPELSRQTRLALTSGQPPSEAPLFAVGYRPDPGVNYAIARQWSRQISKQARRLEKRFDFSRRPKNRGRITIGYLSSDYRDHPVAHQIMGLPLAHSRSDFRIFCYSAGIDDGSSYRKHLERTCDKFIDIRNLQDPEAADQIYDDDVDILVDLNGHTAGNRLGVCALRPAPVQATFLGFPGTSGAGFFDYIITDRIVTPETDLRHYSEMPVYLPDTYMITDDTQAIAKQSPRRAEAGLPETGFVYCSFNSAFKFEPAFFSAWLSILEQVPDSCLWLPQSSAFIKENLMAEADAGGIDSGRLIFAPRLKSKADYLARLKLADIALDTRIYNGHVSTCDALWAGVPVLALTGTHFASRVSTSILTALDMRELITGSVDEYIRAAVRLAKEPTALNRIREKLARHRQTQPLFKTAPWIRHLETAFHKMWQNFRNGAAACRIDIASEN
jgi:protein O-GlcNAc transferase